MIIFNKFKKVLQKVTSKQKKIFQNTNTIIFWEFDNLMGVRVSIKSMLRDNQNLNWIK